MCKEENPASGCTGPSDCYASPICLQVVLAPEDNPECATMYALDQVMGYLERLEEWKSAKPRVAQWFFAKYGHNASLTLSGDAAGNHKND
jgi:hypothetical protein